jgi:hypothetical protein
MALQNVGLLLPIDRATRTSARSVMQAMQLKMQLLLRAHAPSRNCISEQAIGLTFLPDQPLNYQ